MRSFLSVLLRLHTTTSKVVFISETSTLSSCKTTKTTTSCTSTTVHLTRLASSSKSTCKKGTSPRNTLKWSSTRKTRKLCTTSTWVFTSTASQARSWQSSTVMTLSSAGTFWLCSTQCIRETRQRWLTVISWPSTTTTELNLVFVTTSTKTCSSRTHSGTLGICQELIWWLSTVTCSRKSRFQIWLMRMEHSLITLMIEQYWRHYCKWRIQESVWSKKSLMSIETILVLMMLQMIGWDWAIWFLIKNHIIIWVTSLLSKDLLFQQINSTSKLKFKQS